MLCQKAERLRGTARILVVEDSAIVRTNLREWLEGVFPAAQVLEASSGEEAMALMEAAGAEIVVMDVGLPGINGIDTVRRIKASRPATSVVMLTIYEDLEYRRQAAQAGADAYVFKRSMASDLIPILTRMMAEAGGEGKRTT